MAGDEVGEPIEGEGDAIYVVAGGRDGYVGRDGRMPEGESRGGSS